MNLEEEPTVRISIWGWRYPVLLAALLGAGVVAVIVGLYRAAALLIGGAA